MDKNHKHHTDSHHHHGNHGSHNHHGKHHKPKKKIGLFYKFHFFILLLISIILGYFIILVSAGPKSIPFVKEKAESILREKFGEEVALDNSYISFTRYGTLKVALTSVKILYMAPGSSEKQAFIIPRLESEFSLLNFVLLRFQPSKIKIINPDIVIDDLQKLQQQSSDEILNQPSQIAFIIKLLSSIRKGEIPIKNLEIENAKLRIRGQEINTEILIKKSQIRTSIQKKILHISSVNKISFDEKSNDVDFNSNCQLSKHDGLKCDIVLANFIADSIANLHPNLKLLHQIGANLNASASFMVKNGEMSNILFKAEAQRGSFDFPDFFSQKMDFTNFTVKGEYDNKLGILDLSEIATDFTSELQDPKNSSNPPKSHLTMSLVISDFKNPQSKKLDFYIKLQNVLNDEMEKFWPSSLSEQGIRDWVISHVTGGLIKNAYAKFSMTSNENGYFLNDITSEVIFSGFNLEYDKDFPAISNVSGIASFTKDAMKISILSGNVLNSKISDGIVAIDDFHAPITLLKIYGKSHGSAADGLKHIDHKSEFATEIEKYLNGNSQNDFDVRIPLHQTNLKNTYIAVNSTVTGLDNGYVRGGVIINSKKDFNSTNFVTNIDFTAAELIAKTFDIEKKLNVESGLDLIVSVKDPKKIKLKNISLWKKEPVEEKNPKQKTSETQFEMIKITGDVEFETAPFVLTAVNFKNDNFGKNNYLFSYKTNKEKSEEKLFIKGQQFNLGSLIEGKFFQDSSEKKNFINSQVQIATNNLVLMRNKSVKNFYLSLNCRDKFCYRGLIKGNYGKKQSINLRAGKKKPKDDFVSIDGRITDIGYLAEALGISNVVSSGDAKVELQNKIINKKPVLEGEITIDSNITIYENATVKRLAKNDLFSQIKDKIFSSEKTTFDSVKLEFDIQGDVLNIKSLIANNYKIGITAKGFLNLKDGTYEIKGMIIPGFLINNLFGIGNLPILGNLLTGGEGGGLFGIRYTYVKKKGDKEGTFDTNKVAAFVPSTIQNLFD